MKVELLQGRVGDRFSQVKGQVIEVADEEGRRLVEAGQAKPYGEAATDAPPGRQKPGRQ